MEQIKYKRVNKCVCCNRHKRKINARDKDDILTARRRLNYKGAICDNDDWFEFRIYLLNWWDKE